MSDSFDTSCAAINGEWSEYMISYTNNFDNYENDRRKAKKKKKNRNMNFEQLFENDNVLEMEMRATKNWAIYIISFDRAWMRKCSVMRSKAWELGTLFHAAHANHKWEAKENETRNHVKMGNSSWQPTQQSFYFFGYFAFWLKNIDRIRNSSVVKPIKWAGAVQCLGTPFQPVLAN